MAEQSQQSIEQEFMDEFLGKETEVPVEKCEINYAEENKETEQFLRSELDKMLDYEKINQRMNETKSDKTAGVPLTSKSKGPRGPDISKSSSTEKKDEVVYNSGTVSSPGSSPYRSFNYGSSYGSENRYSYSSGYYSNQAASQAQAQAQVEKERKEREQKHRKETEKHFAQMSVKFGWELMYEEASLRVSSVEEGGDVLDMHQQNAPTYAVAEKDFGPGRLTKNKAPKSKRRSFLRALASIFDSTSKDSKTHKTDLKERMTDHEK